MTNRPNNSSVMRQGDIQNYADEISSLKKIDVVFGGPPCQGFSVAGKMSKTDPRNILIDTFINSVITIKPKVFVMENVKALAISPRWESLRRNLLTKVQLAGYNVSLQVYNTADYGVSENRERMLLVGTLSGDICSFHEEMLSHRKPAASLKELLNSVGQFGSEINPITCTAKITLARKPVLRKTPYSGMLVNGSGRPLNLNSFSPTLTASMGGNRTPIVDQNVLSGTDTVNWFEKLYLNIVQTKSMPVWEVPEYLRRLTVKEAAAIQTFPRKYIFSGPYSSIYRQIGNAVPCEFAHLVASSVREVWFE